MKRRTFLGTCAAMLGLPGFAMPAKLVRPGPRTLYVQSKRGMDAAGYGKSPDRPFASLWYAMGACKPGGGDTITMLPGSILPCELVEAVREMRES